MMCKSHASSHRSFRRAITGKFNKHGNYAHSRQTPAIQRSRAAPPSASLRASRTLVKRTARWGEPPLNGFCRLCYELTTSPEKRWHPYCLNACRVAFGQHCDETQHTLCEMCGNSYDEMDHRLAIEAARVLGPAVMLRAFTPRDRVERKSSPIRFEPVWVDWRREKSALPFRSGEDRKQRILL